MSRIGKQPVSIPSGVKVSVVDNVVVVQGASSQLSTSLLPGISASVTDQEVVISRANNEQQTRANHGLIRSLIANHVAGVTQGFKKTLKLIGTGYRAAAKGVGVSLSVGYSHPIEVLPPQGVKILVEGNDTIVISGADKQLVGQVAANIRKVRPPEPYKGKGIRYEDEVVRRKQGKAVAA